MEFCRECNNMLYPKENKATKELMLACRHCDFEKEAESPTIYHNKLKRDTAMRLDLVDPDLARDPTLPRTFDIQCENCGGNEAVFFMSRSGGRDSDMALVFLCANSECAHKWMN